MCSIEPGPAVLRSPKEPSALTINFGTMNNEIPREPAGAFGVFASTRWMMFSERSWSPPVIKILVPVILYVPSAFGLALVLIIPKSVPECGSVKHIVPDHSPVYILGK